MSRLQTLEREIIAAFRKFDPEKIILFGSIVRGDWDEAGDVDVIVVYPTEKRFLSRLRELYMSWNIPKAVDILAYSPLEFEELMKTSFFLQDAVKKGRVIYERA